MWENGRQGDEKAVSYGLITRSHFENSILLNDVCVVLVLISVCNGSRCVDSLITTFSGQKLTELLTKLKKVR